MRFKANVINPKSLQHILQALEKFDKQCTIKLSKQFILFIVKSDALTNTEIWSRVSTSSLFTDFRIESLNNNEIFIDVNMKNIVQVLSNLGSSNSISVKQMIMKLTKKSKQPYLTCEIQTTQTHNNLSQNIGIVQDIPIRLLSQPEANALKEIAIEEPRVQLVLPTALKELKAIIDRMKSLSKSSGNLTIQGFPNGRLELSIETPENTVRTVFSNLSTKEDLQRSQNDLLRNDPEIVSVEIKRISKFLHVHVVQPEEVTLMISNTNVLVLNANINGGYITYYISVNRGS